MEGRGPHTEVSHCIHKSQSPLAPDKCHGGQNLSPIFNTPWAEVPQPLSTAARARATLIPMKCHKGQSPSSYKMPQGQEPSSLLNTTTPDPINCRKIDKVLLAQCVVLKGGEWRCGVEGGQGVVGKEGDPTKGVFLYIHKSQRPLTPIHTQRAEAPQLLNAAWAKASHPYEMPQGQKPLITIKYDEN